jgi:hypothetical protein
MPRTKVVLNSPGMRELLTSDGVRADLERRAEAVAAQARSTAPVQTGDYRDGIEVFGDTTDRAVVRVGSTVRYAPLVEAKTGNLARALDAAGGA